MTKEILAFMIATTNAFVTLLVKISSVKTDEIVLKILSLFNNILF